MHLRRADDTGRIIEASHARKGSAERAINIAGKAEKGLIYS